MTRIVVLEEHNQALGVWQDAGGRPRPLVTFDQHLDLDFIPTRACTAWVGRPGARHDARICLRGPSTPVTISNFLYAALRGGLVASIRWHPSPEALGSTAADRVAGLYRHLSAMDRIAFETLERMQRFGDAEVEVPVYASSLRVATTAGLAAAGRDAIALRGAIWDLDMDALYDRRARLQPSRVAKLRDLLRGLRHPPPLVTVSLSVLSGFCPRAAREDVDHVVEAIRDALGRTSVTRLDAEGRPARAASSDPDREVNSVLSRMLVTREVREPLVLRMLDAASPADRAVSAERRFLVACCLERMGRLREATALFDELLASGRVDRGQVLRKLAAIRLREGDLAGACGLLRQVRPQRWSDLLRLGEAEAARGRSEEAIRLALRAARRNELAAAPLIAAHRLATQTGRTRLQHLTDRRLMGIAQALERLIGDGGTPGPKALRGWSSV